MRRLLILACSQRKRPDAVRLPAIDRYDGPSFRVLRRYCRLRPADGLCVYILSAQYGLIPAARRIRTYDRRMTPKRADDLRARVVLAARMALSGQKPAKVLICAGKTYLRALDGLTKNTRRTSVARGGQGEKLAFLKSWLHER